MRAPTDSARPDSAAPNVLLVVMDTARADAFEPYTAPAGSSPAVADLASRGRAFRHVYSTANWTVPSHASMLSALQPGAVGLGQVPGGPLQCRPVLSSLRPRLLPEVLRKSGYAASGVSTNLWVTDKTGFDTGFDRFEVVTADRDTHLHSSRLKHRVGWDLENVLARRDDGAFECERILRGWLDEKDDRPFFWFVNLTECHSPYLPPRPYNDLGLVGRLRAAEEARRYLNLGAIWRVCLGGATIPRRTVERMRHLYRQSIKYMDDWLARVLELLETRKLLDDTVVIVTSDHGENLGESNLIGHAFSLDDRLIRVPFVSSHAGLFEGATNSLADLPAAICDLAGIEDHPYDGDGSVDGIAVAEMERLTEPTDPRAEEVSKSWELGEDGFHRLTSSGWCACDGRYKLVEIGGQEVLYDVVFDPLETRPTSVGVSTDGHMEAVAAKLRVAAQRVMAGSVHSPRAPEPGP
ncbi:MAG: sulfatase-like hydrolase/transferase, partial [Acidimicrobiales bacterium]